MEADPSIDNSPEDKIFELLNNEHVSAAEKRSALIQHIRVYAALYENSEHRPEDIAYRLAGLMSTKYVMSLEEDDPLEAVLTMAGDLELPKPQQSDESSWHRLLEMVNGLH